MLSIANKPAACLNSKLYKEHWQIMIRIPAPTIGAF